MCAVSVLIAIFAPTKHGEVGKPTPALPKGGSSMALMIAWSSAMAKQNRKEK
jgi:hypothetical protein